MSIAAIVHAAESSIYGLDPEDCEHITGRMYGGEVCGRILTELEVLEVSVVGRPAQPDARIMKVSIDTEDLQAALGPEWKPGVPVSCDRCLNAGTGISDPFLGH
jgi:hypothetical protein